MHDNHPRHYYRHLLACLLLPGLVSCSAPPPPAPGRSASEVGKTYPQIMVHDRLETVLEFGPPVVDRPPNRPVRVEVPILAATRGNTGLRYRFEFFDLADSPIDRESRWRYISLPGGEQEFVSGVSLDRQVADWRLTIREAK